MKEILKALSEVKKEMGVLVKNTQNPFFKSKYFDINQLLEHTEPILEKNGLIVLQPIRENKVYSEIYHIESGEKMDSFLELPNLQDPQKIGSAVTYYRRYTLGSLLGIQAEDDDANKASGNNSKNEKDGTTPTSGNEPTQWLNLYEKDGTTPTRELNRINSKLQSGEVVTVAELRKHYKISKAVAEQLEKIITNFKQSA